MTNKRVSSREGVWVSPAKDVRLGQANGGDQAGNSVSLEAEVIGGGRHAVGRDAREADAGIVKDDDLPVGGQRAQQPRCPVAHGAGYANHQHLQVAPTVSLANGFILLGLQHLAVMSSMSARCFSRPAS